MLAQHFVDTRLPSWPGCAEPLNDVWIEPKAHGMLGRLRTPPAAQAALDIDGIDSGCRPHPGEMFVVERQGVSRRHSRPRIIAR
jgi:hypothetical protein